MIPLDSRNLDSDSWIFSRLRFQDLQNLDSDTDSDSQKLISTIPILLDSDSDSYAQFFFHFMQVWFSAPFFILYGHLIYKFWSTFWQPNLLMGSESLAFLWKYWILCKKAWLKTIWPVSTNCFPIEFYCRLVWQSFEQMKYVVNCFPMSENKKINNGKNRQKGFHGKCSIHNTIPGRLGWKRVHSMIMYDLDPNIFLWICNLKVDPELDLRCYFWLFRYWKVGTYIPMNIWTSALMDTCTNALTDTHMHSIVNWNFSKMPDNLQKC